ncbi:acyl-CoA dehydrogenase family protein [Streptomyces sp. NBC_01216]|uniref:acyl-CoA dehydrogenase family protein n=1 Tax=unclassified Streptomyces TaxID=2593676 RepID=UPI002E0E8657|nr:acyl-CoA/acyl-ACP dehydrogenase [Streptomyces sp. NBC_01216]
MDFRLTDDQKALKAGVREMLTARFGPDALRAAVASGRLDRALWRDLGELGFFALRLPEESGGVGLGPPEAVLVFEEAGRALLPGPLVATHLAAGEVPGAAEGKTVVTAPGGPFVEWLDEADVVRGDTSGAAPVRSVDPLTPLHRLPDTAAPAAWRTGAAGVREGAPAGPVSEPAVALGALLTAAEQLGSAGRTTEAAVRHARARQQFGRPVGAFQAVKHLCAEMLVRTEVARAAVYAAAVTGDPVEIAGAKLLADEAAVGCARDCLQVHGGMGFTWEAEVHLHLKRAWVRAERWIPRTLAEEVEAACL